LPEGDITWRFTELVDIGEIFNPTTGRLSIKDDGVYEMHVSARKSRSYGKEGLIKVYKNQHLVQQIYDTDEKNKLMMNAVFTLHLKKGDEVKLYNQFDKSISVRSYNPLTFTGYKI